MVNGNKLRGKIVEKGIPIEDIAAKLCICRQSLTRKLHNQSDFKVKELVMLCNILGITDIKEVFYTQGADE